MKDTILSSAITILVRDGLNNWTVEEVAKKAGCAKGLVNYHYRSKQALLQQAAETVRAERWAKRETAARTPGSQALDRLWAVLLDDVKTGQFAAWLGLLSAGGPLRQAAASQTDQSLATVAALSRSLGLDNQLAVHAGMIAAALDGLELQLLQGAPPGQTEEAYHQFWLTVLDM